MVRWHWEREGVKDSCYNLLLAAAAACPWPDRSAMDISSGATCVADLDYGALALTKEASGDSRVLYNKVLHSLLALQYAMLSITFNIFLNFLKHLLTFSRAHLLFIRPVTIFSTFIDIDPFLHAFGLLS